MWWVERWPFACGSTGNGLRAGVLLYPAALPNAHCARNVYFSTCLPFSWCLSPSLFFLLCPSLSLRSASFQPDSPPVSHCSPRPSPPSSPPVLLTCIFQQCSDFTKQPGTSFRLCNKWYFLHYLLQKYWLDMIALLNHNLFSRFVNILFFMVNFMSNEGFR